MRRLLVIYMAIKLSKGYTSQKTASTSTKTKQRSNATYQIIYPW